MHMPENYLSPSTCIVLDIIFVVLLVVAIKKTHAKIPRERIPLLGFAAAISCLVMMVDLPISGGTSAHAVCAVIIAILFGPWAAVVAVTAALLVQTVLFGNGGLLCLGANAFVMAFILPFVGYGIYWIFSRLIKGLRGELLGGFVGSYIALVISSLISAIFCSLQPLLFHDSLGNALYAPYPLTVAIPSILANALALWGFVEAILTCVLLIFFRKKCTLFPIERKKEVKTRTKIAEPMPDWASLKSTVILCAILSVIIPIISLFMHATFGIWNIEAISANVGYIPTGIENGWAWSGIFPMYTIFSLPYPLTYIICGILGSAINVGIFKLLSFAYKPANKLGAKIEEPKAQVKHYDEYVYEIDEEEV